jgi:hypothetical protein
MLPRRSRCLLLALLILLTNLAAMPGQQEDRQWFNKFGHWVTGEFLDFYNSVDDPDRLFGSPITDAFPDSLRQGIMIQYFERVRMDLDPTLPEGKRVRLANLGLWMYDEAQRGQPVNYQDNTSLCRIFANGKKVCYAFLQLYDRYGGAEMFGQPVSDVEEANGRPVQYFENVRLEWRNEMPVGQKVVVTEIGRIDFDRRIGNDELIGRNPTGITGDQDELRVRAFAARPLVTGGSRQTIYVITHDQFLKPWADVQIYVKLKYPGEPEETHSLDKLTGGEGLAAYEFTIPEVAPNQVIEVVVEARFGDGPSAATTTWFRSWW